VVLRPEAVRERLLRLEEVISRLEELDRLAPPGAPEDFRDTWAAERGLQVGCEIILDVGNHVLSAHFGASPDDYEDILRQLAARGVVDETLYERLKGLGGFRNILVHGYLAIDPARVAAARAKAPTDFSDFARALRTWLAKTLG
jgi:uncharacterized protein YutE (UPF0331/DUF86 family)